ncbi:AAA family ATPase [Ferrimonas balearica]|uniref:AAA family ATPase n=1 Tax=Ferrimonas balearica TaxID=44012 RepID=UPI001C99604A|nr:AAA family ATPase [Ferrimonas balearica]MBY5992769.1 AAA family ATPase [Ferrimonas balearica]
MKILAIRGENLASLARPFDIPLGEGPLAQSGLFAITGPTGSGKSTLLDALCLALYDQTPRYTTGRQGAAVGARGGDDKLWLKSNDVRQILSRGKAEGHAEVEFIGIDGQRYCARWTVRRARGRAEGRMQHQEMSLTHLVDAKVESGKKTEVLASIEAKVGLSWEQFRRAVLLAQGEFAAFLKASPKQRSELLERLTGTEIYSRIGAAAFERGRDAEQQMSRLAERRAHLELMDPEALAALEAEQAQLAAGLARGQALVADAAAVTTLAQQCQGQQAKIDAAMEAETALAEQQDAFDALAAELEVFDRAQAARPLYQELSQLEVALAESQPRLTRLEEDSARQQAEIDRLTQRLPTLTEAQTRCDAQWQRWQGQRGEAEQLERQRQGVQAEHAQLQTQLTPQRQALSKRQAQQAELAQAQQAREQEQRQLGETLNANRALVALAGQWPQWRNRLLALGRDGTQWHALRQQQRQGQPALAQEQAQLAQFTEQEQGLDAQAQTLAARLTQWRAQEPAQPDPEARTAQEQALRQLLRYLELGERLRPAQQRSDALTARLAELAEHQARWAPQRSALEQRIQAERATLAEAQHQHQQAQATLALEDYRPLLQPEQPCPLCGGTDHPYAEHNPAVSAVLTGMLSRVETLTQGLESTQAELQRGQVLAQQQRLQAEQLEAERLELAQGLAEGRAEQHALEAQQPQWASCSVAQLQETAAQWEQALGQSHQAQQQWRQWQQGLNQLQQQTEQLHRARAEAQEQRHHWALKVKEGEERQARLKTELARLQGALQAERQELAAVLPDLPWSALGQEPQGMGDQVAELDASVAALGEVQSRLAALETLGQEQAEQAQQHALAMQELRASLALMEPKLEALTEQAERLSSVLAALLEGETLAERHQRLGEQQAQAQEALTQAQEALSRARTEQVALTTTLEQQRQQLAQQQDQRRDSLARWSELLQSLGLAQQQVLALMGRDHQWRQAQQQRLSAHQLAREGARRDRERAQAELSERQAAHRQADAAWQQQLAQSEFEAADLSALKAALTTLERSHFECRHRLAQQSSLQQQALDLEAQQHQAEADCRVWLQLKEVIGSADGSRFRAMAQSLTLAQLLSLANAQLAELAPRYRLQPTPGNGLDLQVVDGDMGEEIRAIESLSGGETFLVSLALALALSALTTGGGRIGSLFIDEGFGTLDPDSLELALSCLDALQAAGRQVGVISHVQTLVERIGTRVQLSAAGGGTSQLRLIER